MTARGRFVLVLGLAVYLASWVFGSRPLVPVAVGLVLAVVLARAWVALADRPLRVRRRWRARELLEGDDVRVELELEPDAGVRSPVLVCADRAGALGLREVALERSGRFLHGGYELRNLRRGRVLLGPIEAVLEDPFGLARRERSEGVPSVLLVYPRLVEVDRLFGRDTGPGAGGRRLLLRRPSGFELHSVREYDEGESLRRVHWPSTARRGRLMVKDVSEASRDEVAVVLDADAAGAAVFDLQVRAAGSVLRWFVAGGRRGVLVLNGVPPVVQLVRGEAEWQRARELLAAVEPVGRTWLAALLAAEDGAARRAQDVVVVTAALEPTLVERLLQLSRSHRRAALVYADANRLPQPSLLRLQAAGVAVAVVREGEDLAAALAGTPPPKAAHG
jgi:uncharacterized protein (DUF58 family)